MVVAELKKLFSEKEYRLFLVLFLWLLIGFTLFQFTDILPVWIAFVVFLPLLVICAILFIMSFVFRTDIKELSFKKIVIYLLIALVLFLLFVVIIAMIIIVLFMLAIISYVIITATFYMYGCYDGAVDLDDKILEMKGAKKPILRWSLFLGSTLISLVLMVIILNIAVHQMGRTTGEVQFSFDRMVILMVVLMLFLLVLGILFLFKGSLNAWLGLFFLFCCIYYLYLVISAYNLLISGGAKTTDIGARIALYIFDVLLIIYTTATLIGKKTEVISEKVKFIKPDGILMWLIFSKASYEFAAAAFSETMNITVFNALAGLVIFTVLFLIAGLYGIISYGKRKKKAKKSVDNIES